MKEMEHWEETLEALRAEMPESGADAAAEAVQKAGAALIPGVGAIVCGKDEDDTEALAILAQKAAVAALHAQALDIRADLSGLDDLLMHLVYTKKYARQKG